jgi:hypothetical protein
LDVVSNFEVLGRSVGDRKWKRSFTEISSQPAIANNPPIDRLSPPSHSQPAGDTTTNSVFADMSFEQLERELWKTIRARVGEISSDFRYCRAEYHPIFTRNRSMPATHEVVRKLINTPLLVSSAELSQIFRLRRCEEDTLPQRDAETIYYIRTFPIPKKQLEDLITSWEASYRTYTPVPHWIDFLRSIKSDDDDTIIYIRYIGMARGGRTAWDRFKEDLQGRTNGVLAAFTQTILNSHPAVFANCELHEILGATIPNLPPTDDGIRDDRERVVIALFDRNVSLNQQGGGFYPAYVPKQSDHRLFGSFNTSFFDTFARMVETDEMTRYEMCHKVSEWVGKVETYALEHPVETCTYYHPLTESYLNNVIKTQAMPATIKGMSLLVLFGKDVTLEDFLGENTFLSGNSRAGKMTIDTLAGVHQFEHNFAQALSSPFVDGQFPFVDLYPWMGHLGTEGAVDLVREYFAVTRPRIMVTFSQTVSSWVASRFVHGYGLGRLFPRLILLISKSPFS